MDPVAKVNTQKSYITFKIIYPDGSAHSSQKVKYNWIIYAQTANSSLSWRIWRRANRSGWLSDVFSKI